MSLCVMGAKFVRCLVLSRRFSSDFDIFAAISLQQWFGTATNSFKTVEDQQQSLCVLKIRWNVTFSERNCGCVSIFMIQAQATHGSYVALWTHFSMLSLLRKAVIAPRTVKGSHYERFVNYSTSACLWNKDSRVMFAVIDYAHQRQDDSVFLSVHGYAATEESAVKYAKKTLASLSEGCVVIPIDDEHNERSVYFQEHPNSKVLHEFIAVEFDICTDEDCSRICKNIIRNENSVKNKSQITIGHVLRAYDVQESDVSEAFDANEIIGSNYSRFKEFLHFLLKNDSGTIRSVLLNHGRPVSDDVVAVVEMRELPDEPVP